jgi:hypothetical protein
MSYTKLTDFAAKDALISGNPNKVIRGVEIGTEFDAIQTADALNVKTTALGTGVAAALASPTGTGSMVLSVSPALTGTPTVPTATASTNTTQVASTAYADAAVLVEKNRALAVEALKATIDSPTFTGVPAAPTATAGTSTTQLATTAFVQTTAFSAALPAQTGNSGKFVTTNGSTASWADIGYPVVIVSGTTQTAVAGSHYILTNVAATTVTLPVAPNSGDTVWITPDNGLTTNVINFNGKDHQNVTWATDPTMTIDNAQATVEFRYVNGKWRLV